MPLDELIPLGYSIDDKRFGDQGIVQVEGHGQNWWIMPDDDVEAVVTLAKNAASLHDKLTQMVTYFSGNFANWATMTAQQKDAANRQAQRGLANLARYALRDISSAGD